MEDFARHISIQAEGTQNVLVIQLRENEALVPYCCKVMETNHIPGLLRMRHQIVDGTVCLRYNIGGKVPLRDFMLQHQLTRRNSLQLLRNLSNALLNLNEYFLSTDMCYLDPELLYIGDGLCAFMPCVPAPAPKGQNSSVQLKRFYEKLLSDYFTSIDGSFVDMFMWVYRAVLFDLETFYNQFLREESPAPTPQAPSTKQVVSSAPAPIVQVPPVSPPPTAEESKTPQLVDQLQEKLKKVSGFAPGVSSAEKSAPDNIGTKSENTAAEVFTQPQGAFSFAIPGAAPAKAAEVAASKSNKPAADAKRKGFMPFGRHSKKVEPAVEAFPEPAPVPESIPVPPAPVAAPMFPVESTQSHEPMVAPQSQDDWDDGTFLINRPESPALSNVPDVSSSSKPYFVHQGQRIVITETPFMVGKYNTSCTLHYAVYDNNKVSRCHATFLLVDGQYMIRDNQSRNGTFLNGKALVPLQPVPLHEGDEIKLYDEVLIFHMV